MAPRAAFDRPKCLRARDLGDRERGAGVRERRHGPRLESLRNGGGRQRTDGASHAGVGQPAHLIQLHLAIVQGAVYDAVNAIDGGHQLYLVAPAADPSDSREAAAATAAHEAGRTQGARGRADAAAAGCDWLDPLYTQSLAAVPDESAKTAGIAIGEAAASAMLAERADDGRFGTFQFAEGFDPGEWRLAPPQGPTGIVARDPAPGSGT